MDKIIIEPDSPVKVKVVGGESSSTTEVEVTNLPLTQTNRLDTQVSNKVSVLDASPSADHFNYQFLSIVIVGSGGATIVIPYNCICYNQTYSQFTLIISDLSTGALENYISDTSVTSIKLHYMETAPNGNCSPAFYEFKSHQ